jgi:hypothetical protein
MEITVTYTPSLSVSVYQAHLSCRILRGGHCRQISYVQKRIAAVALIWIGYRVRLSARDYGVTQIRAAIQRMLIVPKNLFLQVFCQSQKILPRAHPLSGLGEYRLELA